MAIINQFDKRSGITYVYESHSFRDKETGKVKDKRRLIGRRNTETGEIVPTDGRCRKKKAAPAPAGTDYQKRCDFLEKKCVSQEVLIETLQRRIAELEGSR